MSPHPSTQPHPHTPDGATRQHVASEMIGGGGGGSAGGGAAVPFDTLGLESNQTVVRKLVEIGEPPDVLFSARGAACVVEGSEQQQAGLQQVAVFVSPLSLWLTTLGGKALVRMLFVEFTRLVRYTNPPVICVEGEYWGRVVRLILQSAHVSQLVGTLMDRVPLELPFVVRRNLADDGILLRYDSRASRQPHAFSAASSLAARGGADATASRATAASASPASPAATAAASGAMDAEGSEAGPVAPPYVASPCELPTAELPADVEWLSSVVNHGVVHHVEEVRRVTSKGKQQPRLFVLTDSCFYMVDLSKGKRGITRCTDIFRIARVFAKPEGSGGGLIGLKIPVESFDSLFYSNHHATICNILTTIAMTRHNCQLPIVRWDATEFTKKQVSMGVVTIGAHHFSLQKPTEYRVRMYSPIIEEQESEHLSAQEHAVRQQQQQQQQQQQAHYHQQHQQQHLQEQALYPPQHGSPHRLHDALLPPRSSTTDSNTTRLGATGGHLSGSSGYEHQRYSSASEQQQQQQQQEIQLAESMYVDPRQLDQSNPYGAVDASVYSTTYADDTHPMVSLRHSAPTYTGVNPDVLNYDPYQQQRQQQQQQQEQHPHHGGDCAEDCASSAPSERAAAWEVRGHVLEALRFSSVLLMQGRSGLLSRFLSSCAAVVQDASCPTARLQALCAEFELLVVASDGQPDPDSVPASPATSSSTDGDDSSRPPSDDPPPPAAAVVVATQTTASQTALSGDVAPPPAPASPTHSRPQQTDAVRTVAREQNTDGQPPASPTREAGQNTDALAPLLRPAEDETADEPRSPHEVETPPATLDSACQYEEHLAATAAPQPPPPLPSPPRAAPVALPAAEYSGATLVGWDVCATWHAMHLHLRGGVVYCEAAPARAASSSPPGGASGAQRGHVLFRVSEVTRLEVRDVRLAHVTLPPANARNPFAISVQCRSLRRYYLVFDRSTEKQACAAALSKVYRAIHSNRKAARGAAAAAAGASSKITP